MAPSSSEPFRERRASEVKTDASSPSSTTPSLPTVSADVPSTPTPSRDNDVLLSSMSEMGSASQLAPTSSVAQTLTDALEQVYRLNPERESERARAQSLLSRVRERAR